MDELLYKEDHHKIKFKCKKCATSCRNSNIRLSPYDILRLCKRAGMSSTEFIEKHADFKYDAENKSLLTCMLRTAGACLFLKDDLCTVYDDRPLGCRLYPLAIDPFVENGNIHKKFYVVGKCPGFDTKFKVSVGEFKQSNKLDADDLCDPWFMFVTKLINAEPENSEEFYAKFYSVCYDFDGALCQNILADNNVLWPEDIGERFKIIMKLANEMFL